MKQEVVADFITHDGIIFVLRKMDPRWQSLVSTLIASLEKPDFTSFSGRSLVAGREPRSTYLLGASHLMTIDAFNSMFVDAPLSKSSLNDVTFISEFEKALAEFASRGLRILQLLARLQGR